MYSATALTVAVPVVLAWVLWKALRLALWYPGFFKYVLLSLGVVRHLLA